MAEEEVRSSATIDPSSQFGRSSSPPATPAASSAGASSPAMPTHVGSVDWFGSAQGSKAGSVSHTVTQKPHIPMSINANVSSQEGSELSCRPWERGDLLRRLATFMPSNWLGKPKGVNSLACARKGWVNINNDKIQCELCGARLQFSTAATWTLAEVDKAAEAFTQQLDASHDVTCPWRGNCCADSLVQFPPTSPTALVGGYKDRWDGLLQFPSLPVISPLTVEKMRLSRSAQIDQFLSQLPTYPSEELDLRLDDASDAEFSLENGFYIYYHARKFISLCGWEPRWLPNVQDFEHSTQSARNACSFDPTEDDARHHQHPGMGKNASSDDAVRELGKSLTEARCNSRSLLLDCSLCGATIRISNFLTVPRPVHFGPNNIETTDTSKKMLIRGTSAASGINEWADADEMEKEKTVGHDDAATTDEGKSLSNACVDFNLTIAGGLPSAQSDMPAMSDNFNDGGMGRDLMIRKPAVSEVGGHAVSYEPQRPSARKRSLEEAASTVDRPLDRILQADSMEGTVIDRDGDDDDIQCSDGPSKHARGLEIFGTYHSSCKVGSCGAGPSRNLCFDIDIDVNRVDSSKEGSELAPSILPIKDSTRVSSVVAMDIVCHSSQEDSLESVENCPGGPDDVQCGSRSMSKNLDVNEAFEFDNDNQVQQIACQLPAGGSGARGMGIGSKNEGVEILNAETTSSHSRDGFSVGVVSSHEAEIHGADVSVHIADGIVGDAEPIDEVTEHRGQTGVSTPGHGLMDEFVPAEIDREDHHGDSQEMMSQSVGEADSGSKIYGSRKADSVGSVEKISHTLRHENSAHPSLSCNAVIYSACEASKGEVTPTGKRSEDFGHLEADHIPSDVMGVANGENNCGRGEFDPIKHHNIHCPWVDGNVAAAGCVTSVSSSGSSDVALSGWEVTLDALDILQSVGHIPSQMTQSESAASLYK